MNKVSFGFIQKHRHRAQVTSQMINFPHKPLPEEYPNVWISFDSTWCRHTETRCTAVRPRPAPRRVLILGHGVRGEDVILTLDHRSTSALESTHTAPHSALTPAHQSLPGTAVYLRRQGASPCAPVVLARYSGLPTL